MNLGWRRKAATSVSGWEDDEELHEVSPELLALIHGELERELASRRELNARLTATITFAGVLLALGFGQGHRLGNTNAHGPALATFQISFAAAVALLVLSIGLAVWGLLPTRRDRSNPDVLRHYVRVGSGPDELRVDFYKTAVDTLQQTGTGNDLRGERLLKAQRALVLALVLTAVGALILFFDHGRQEGHPATAAASRQGHAAYEEERPRQAEADQATDFSHRPSRGPDRGRR